MKIQVWEQDWVDTATKRDIFLSIRGKTFENKEEAENDSSICMIFVLYHLVHEDSFTDDGVFIEPRIRYGEFATMFEALDLKAYDYKIQELYAKATRGDIGRVQQIMEAIGG